MKTNSEIQAALVGYLKSKSPFYTVSSDEIRENMWKGHEFNYPNIRVDLRSNIPINGCNASTVEFSILCFSTDTSSKEADEIAGSVNALLHKRNFVYNNTRFAGVFLLDLVPARGSEKDVWQSEARYKVIIS